MSRLGTPPEELEEVSREREVWTSLLRLLPRDPAPDKREKMDRLVHHLSGDFLMALISCDLVDLLCLLRPAG